MFPIPTSFFGLSKAWRASLRRTIGFSVASLSLLLLLTPAMLRAEDDYKIKAAFVVNFLKFTTCERFRRPVNLCVAADESAHSSFADIDGIETPVGPIKYIKTSLSKADSGCDLLFVDRNQVYSSATPGVKEIPLVISEDPELLSDYAVLAFYTEDSKVRFAVNLESARSRKVVFSSQLLKLAKIFGN